MNSRYATAQIEDVFLTSDGTADGTAARVQIEDGDRFASLVVAASVTALDASVHTQTQERGVRGIAFGLRVDFCPVAVLQAIISAINLALSTPGSVRVKATDAVNTIDVFAVPDFGQGSWLTHESHSGGGFVKDVRIRFISVGQGM